MKAAKNGSCCDGTEAFDPSMEGRIFVQRAMNSAFIIIGGELGEDPTQMRLPPNTTKWSTHSRRIVPISRYAKPFCHGEPAEIGLSRMPMARRRRVTTAP